MKFVTHNHRFHADLTLEVSFDSSAAVWVGLIRELDIRSQGETRAEAIASVESAFGLWVRNLGRQAVFMRPAQPPAGGETT